MMLKEIRQSIRSLLRQPRFTIPAVLALSLGIGANAVIFSLVNQILLRPLPYRDPDGLVMIYASSPAQGMKRGVMAPADFLDIKNNSTAFQDVAAFQTSRFNLAPSEAEDSAEQLVCSRVTASLFNVLGAGPVAGRLFQPGDDDPSKPSVAVLSERFWKRKYGGSRDAIGKVVTLNSKPYTIVGVAPSSFQFPRRDVEMWASLALDSSPRRSPSFLRAIGRLRPGATVEHARAELGIVAANIERTDPKERANLSLPVISLTEDVVGNVRSTLWMLEALVAVVLLIAIVNVANLTFARGLGKIREIAIQTCLGAKRRHIIRQLLTESLIISLCASVFGLVLAWEAISYLQAVSPGNLPRLHEVSIDLRVMLFTILLAVFSACASGLLPVLRVSNPNLAETLQSAGRTGTETKKNLRLRNALVVLEIAMCFTLLIGGALMAQSFLKRTHVDMGFKANPEKLLIMETYLSGPKYTKERRVQFYQQLMADIDQLPGIESAAVSFILPPDRVNFTNGFEVKGRPAMSARDVPSVPVPIVSADYFKTLEIPLLHGRSFTDADTPTSPPVVIVSEALAKAYFPNQNPVGQQIRESDAADETAGTPWMEIVGEVGDVRYRNATGEIEPVYYRSNNQLVFPYGNYVIVKAKNPYQFVGPIQSKVHAIDRSITISKPETMEELLAESVQQPRLNSLLMGVFAIVSLLLTAIGTYGVMAYSVAQQQHDNGIRIALGALPAHIMKQVLGQGLVLAAIGSGLGAAAALLLGKSLQALLFGISPVDPATYGFVALVVFAVAAFACYMPAKKATQVDPAWALREN